MREPGNLFTFPASKKKTYLMEDIMKTNMGTTDRFIRVILALVFTALYFSGTVTGVFGILLLVFAGVFLLTSIVSICPLYLPFNFSTKQS
jgi:hypothetical protein